MTIAKAFIGLGVMFILIGVGLWLSTSIPGLNRLGKLPGDLRIEGKHYRVYVPIVTCLLLSLFLSLLSYLWGRFRG